MKITKEKALEIIDDLLKISEKVEDSQGSFYVDKFEELAFGTLSLLRNIYGDNSEFSNQILKGKDQYRESKNYITIGRALLQSIKGILIATKSEILNDLTGSLEGQAQGEIFGDFLSLAKQLLNEGHKDASSVLACGALEDSMKKFAKKKGLDVHDKELSAVINSLKSSGHIKGAQSGVVQSYVQLRNKAFHAQFDKIEAPEISSLISFLEQFILTNFE